jgi:thiamine thiazole synthase
MVNSIDEKIITKAIVESFLKDFLSYTECDVAIGGAGPSGAVAAYYLAKKNIKVAIYERKLSPGGGMWGGGMMFPYIVVQTEGKEILDEFNINYHEYEKGYFVASSVEATSSILAKCTKAGAKIFNTISIEDVVIREGDKIEGVVLSWSATDIAKLHVDPLVIKSKYVIDATGHDCEICKIVCRKIGNKLNTPTGTIIGEKPMWADIAEKHVEENTKEIYPNLFVTGMAANAAYGAPRMGPIFGGMLLSGKKVAELIMYKMGLPAQ